MICEQFPVIDGMLQKGFSKFFDIRPGKFAFIFPDIFSAKNDWVVSKVRLKDF